VAKSRGEKDFEGGLASLRRRRSIKKKVDEGRRLQSEKKKKKGKTRELIP